MTGAFPPPRRRGPGALLSTRISAGYRGGPDVLREFELAIHPGEVVGLVGESGSGKSTVALSILRLLEFRGGSTRGELRFQDRDLMKLPEKRMRAVRGREIALVLQSPLSSLNPAMRIGSQILECWHAHQTSKSGPPPDLLELLEMVNLPAEQAFLHRYPRQISVGQAQRILIAMAILHRPSLLIADEPTSALDAVTQAEILKLLSGLSRRLAMSILYISHDLLSVASFCHRIAILREGRIVESGSPAEMFRNPRHPYTRTLLAAIPSPAFLHDNLSDALARK
jgi:ABC-type dipeptide/oligopeptide/nickel transport system ATPase component